MRPRSRASVGLPYAGVLYILFSRNVGELLFGSGFSKVHTFNLATYWPAVQSHRLLFLIDHSLFSHSKPSHV